MDVVKFIMTVRRICKINDARNVLFVKKACAWLSPAAIQVKAL